MSEAHGAVVERINGYMRFYSDRQPDVWRRMDRLREGRVWPDWCYLPTGLIKAPVELPVDEQLGWGRSRDLAAWRATQGIYTFDRTVLESLWDTPVSGDLPVELLHRLPEWCCYVSFSPPHDHLDGVFISLDIVDHEMGARQEALTLGLDIAGKMLPLDILISPGNTLQECLSHTVEYASKTWEALGLLETVTGDLEAGIVKTTKDLEEMALQAYAEPLMSVALYLCSTTAEFRRPGGGEEQPGNPAPVRTRRTGMRLFPPNAPRVWEVAYRLGAALRRAEAEEGNDEQGGAVGDRARPRPHIRRAHWHHFWRGPRDEPEKRELVVRWLPPLPVAFGDDGQVIPTVRRVD